MTDFDLAHSYLKCVPCLIHTCAMDECDMAQT